ncbi:MAG TPA: hypothetical protein VGF82_06620, partial [Terracidiphilus sp.]
LLNRWIKVYTGGLYTRFNPYHPRPFRSNSLVSTPFVARMGPPVCFAVEPEPESIVRQLREITGNLPLGIF